MTDGFTYIRSQSWGALVFLKFCGCIMVIFGSADVLNVAFSEKIYTNGDSNNVAQYGISERLGILFASQGIGCIIAPVIETVTDMEKINSLEAACVVSYLLLGLGHFGMAGIEGLVPLCVFNSVRSAGSNIIYIYSSLMLQVRPLAFLFIIECLHILSTHNLPIVFASYFLIYIKEVLF